MDCYLHPGTSSTATCVSCAQPICYFCREDVAGHPMCKPCIAAASARLADAGTPVQAPDVALPVFAAGAEARPPAAPWLAAPATDLSAAAPAIASGSTAASQDFRPGIGKRLGRGLLWGLIYGQWWTVLTIFWSFFWSHGSVGIGEIIFYAFFYGFFGCVAGLIIGAANLGMSAGTMVGVGVGIVVCLIEMALSHDAGSLVNIFFYFFTGRFVGSGITWRVQQAVK
jgi:hypothetical protein